MVAGVGPVMDNLLYIVLVEKELREGVPVYRHGA